jgi:hypothetical protein
MFSDHSHLDTRHSVGLLWTNDRPVAETSKLAPHNTPNRQTSMSPAGFEPAIPTRNLPPAHLAATGMGGGLHMLTLYIKAGNNTVKLLAEASQTSKRLFMFLWQGQDRTPKHFRKLNGLLIYGDKHYITSPFCKKCAKSNETVPIVKNCFVY